MRPWAAGREARPKQLAQVQRGEARQGRPAGGVHGRRARLGPGIVSVAAQHHKTLWIHPGDGQPPYQVFAFANRDIRIDYPVWSPDGKSVLFDRAVPKGSDLWLLQGVP